MDSAASILAAGRALVPDSVMEGLRRQMGQQQVMQTRLENQGKLAEIQELDAFHQDLQAVMTNPGPKAYSQLILKHPTYAKEAKGAWEMLDKSERDADLRSMGDIYGLAASGRYDKAGALLRIRIEADKAGGHGADPMDEAILEALESGDPKEQKAAVGLVGSHLATIVGPDKFTEAYGALHKGEEAFTLSQGQTRYDAEGKPIAQSAPETRYYSVPQGGKLIPVGPGGAGGDVSGGSPTPSDVPPGPISPAAGAVASTLSSAGMPAPVVAGFIGNFHIEGGYEGAKGDGGEASGIAQWHPDRAAVFQRVIGKPIAQASHAEQAQFVAWEMQHPEEAGMTVAQRDAILAAKTPAQAAALIDQYYERSSGTHRQRRMAAASAFAGGGTPAPSAPRTAPGGAPAASAPQAAPGDPPGTIYGSPSPTYRIMSPAEVQRIPGLDPGVVYQQSPDGQITAVGGQDKPKPLKSVPQKPTQFILENHSTLREINRALALVNKRPKSFGWKAYADDSILQRTDPGGVEARGAVGKIGGKIIHDVSGANVTLSESPRFKPYVPVNTDDSATIIKKLTALRDLAAADAADLSAAWGPENGWAGVKLPGQKPVKVRSVQEARKLPPGTTFELGGHVRTVR